MFLVAIGSAQDFLKPEVEYEQPLLAWAMPCPMPVLTQGCSPLSNSGIKEEQQGQDLLGKLALLPNRDPFS